MSLPPPLSLATQRDWSGSDFSAGLLGLHDSIQALARRVDDLEDKGIAPAPTHAYSHLLRTYVNLYTIIIPTHFIRTYTIVLLLLTRTLLTHVLVRGGAAAVMHPLLPRLQGCLRTLSLLLILLLLLLPLMHTMVATADAYYCCYR